MQDIESLIENIRAENKAEVKAALRNITRLTDLTSLDWLVVLAVAEERINKSIVLKGTPKAIFKKVLKKIVHFATPRTGLGLEEATLTFCMDAIQEHNLKDFFWEIKNPDGFCLLYFFLNNPSRDVREQAQKVSGQQHSAALIQAVERRDIPALESLIKKGANLNFTSSTEKSLLSRVLEEKDSLPLIRFLILHGARESDFNAGLLEYVEVVITECGEFNDYAFLESLHRDKKNRLLNSILNYLDENDFNRTEVFSPLITYLLLNNAVTYEDLHNASLLTVAAKRIEAGDFSVLNGIFANDSMRECHLEFMVKNAGDKMLSVCSRTDCHNPTVLSLFALIKAIVERNAAVDRNLNASLLDSLFRSKGRSDFPQSDNNEELLFELVKLFIANGASVSASCLLEDAVKCNASPRILRCLLENGAALYWRGMEEEMAARNFERVMLATKEDRIPEEIMNGPVKRLLDVLVPQKYHLYFKLKSFDELTPTEQRSVMNGLQEIMRRAESTAEEKDIAVIKLLEENGLYNKPLLTMLMHRRRGHLFSCVAKEVAQMITQYADAPNPVTPAVSAAAPQKNLRS